MDSDELANIFAPFFSTKDVGKGTGLGLSMVYGFVEHSGGKVIVTSKPGEGTTAALLLPASAAAVADTTPGDDFPDIAGSGQTVLILEDECDVRELLVDMLEDRGYQTLEAVDVPAARIAARAADTIDVLLSDMRLPGPDGIVFAQELADDRPDTKIIMMSGYPSGPNEDTRARFDDVLLMKPFSQEQLRLALSKALRGAAVIARTG
jgi:CheY-like chemotaxis protein